MTWSMWDYLLLHSKRPTIKLQSLIFLLSWVCISQYALLHRVNTNHFCFTHKEPGGFLQWEEIDEESYISTDNPVIWELRRCFEFSLKAEGKCFAASAKVYEECTAAGFLDVKRLHYLSSWNSDLRLDTEGRLAATIETLYANLLLRSGQVADGEAASKRARELLEQHRSLCADGKSPPLKVMRVVAQKPHRRRL